VDLFLANPAIMYDDPDSRLNFCTTFVYKIYVTEFSVPNSSYRILCTKFTLQTSLYKIPATEFSAQNPRYRVLRTKFPLQACTINLSNNALSHETHTWHFNERILKILITNPLILLWINRSFLSTSGVHTFLSIVVNSSKDQWLLPCITL
jgi:hypothetical protein